MKSTPKKSDEYTNFEAMLRCAVKVTPENYRKAEAEYQRERAKHPKRGPKPKTR